MNNPILSTQNFQSQKQPKKKNQTSTQSNNLPWAIHMKSTGGNEQIFLAL